MSLTPFLSLSLWFRATYPQLLLESVSEWKHKYVVHCFEMHEGGAELNWWCCLLPAGAACWCCLLVLPAGEWCCLVLVPCQVCYGSCTLTIWSESVNWFCNMFQSFKVPSKLSAFYRHRTLDLSHPKRRLMQCTTFSCHLLNDIAWLGPFPTLGTALTMQTSPRNSTCNPNFTHGIPGGWWGWWQTKYLKDTLHLKTSRTTQSLVILSLVNDLQRFRPRWEF